MFSQGLYPLVSLFVVLVKSVHPCKKHGLQADLSQSEDFGLNNAKKISDKYRPEIPCFNDDVQGTGCITLAAIISGLQVAKLELADIRMVVFGSGSAGIGIADQVRDAIVTEGKKSKEDATKQIWWSISNCLSISKDLTTVKIGASINLDCCYNRMPTILPQDNNNTPGKTPSGKKKIIAIYFPSSRK